MLSISPPIAVAGQGNYYLDLAREDYYLAGGEPLGAWFGEGKEILHLDGTVQREHFQNLLRGFSPDGSSALVKNAGIKDRQTAWDLTFSAPKSVSAAWSQAPPEIRAKFQLAQREAVEAALTYLQEVAGLTRRGRGGTETERAKLVSALFEHGTSRAQDPQLHTHAVLLNLGFRADGTTGTIRTLEVFQHKMAAGAIYRAALAEALQRTLGLDIELDREFFKLAGVSDSLCSEFSKRRKQIEEALSKKGLESAVAAKIAALETREVKGHIARDLLFTTWKAVGREHGWTEENLMRLIGRDRAKEAPAVTAAELSEIAIQTITIGKSHFSERDLVRFVADHAPGKGIRASEILPAVRERIAKDDIQDIGLFRGRRVFTTKDILRDEKDLLSTVRARQQENGHLLDEGFVSKTLSKQKLLSEEQKAAVLHITTRPGAVQVVSGMAGTGKSTMLKAARELWEKSEMQVVGAAISGKAAQGLEESAGIQSYTLAQALHDLNLPAFGFELRYKRLFPNAPRWSPFHDLKLPSIHFKTDALRLTERTVLVLDEAGMVGTKTMKAVLDAVKAAGAKLVLVGDARQLQPIEAGGPFRAIEKLVGSAELKEIKRQKEDWARQMVTLFADGKAKEALTLANEKGMVTKAKTADEVKSKLIADWKKAGIARPDQNLILASRNQDTTELNTLAQAERRTARKLGNQNITVNGSTIYTGDRLLFTKNSKLLGVKNGHLGTITGIKRDALLVALDTGKQVSIPFRSYNQFTLGYAVTTHKAQGMTTENSFVLIDPVMQDRELSYVQASRARNETRFYIDQATAGKYFRQAAKLMSQTRQKDLATELHEAEQRRREEQSQTREQQSQKH